MMDRKDMKVVNKGKAKIDAFRIATGAPVYTDDVAPKEALIVKILRSPHAFARIKSIDSSLALKVPGVECVITHEDVPHIRCSFAGANYPGNNPYDRYILEDLVRYVGDPVAIIAADTEKAAQKAMSLVKVEYEVMEPVLDFEKSEESGIMVHPESDYRFQMDIGGDLSRNRLSYEEFLMGDFDSEYGSCPVKLDEVYYTKQNQQTPMETFRTASYLDTYGRLVVVSSTQVPFHARRLLAQGLGISPSKIRVIKPRIGGGFGAKQSLVSEFFPAIVTLKTGKAAKVVFTRKEAFTASNARHRFRLRVRLGADLDGTVRALAIDSLEDAGAYGEHSVNVIGLSGHKTMPLYGKAKAYRFTGTAVYTNTMAGGAYRGFGATQGCFAVESTVNKMARKLGLDPTEVRLKNLPEVGKVMPAYFDEVLTSCSLDECIKTGKKMIGWDEKYPMRRIDDHTVRGVGMAITMQGSGLTNLDACSATITLMDDGYYQLQIGASDMGTGCDTILAQMAAEVLDCPLESITVDGVDTDHSPYDKGSYASSTTYVTGTAVVLAAKDLIRKMKAVAADVLGVKAEDIDFDGQYFRSEKGDVSLIDIGTESVNGQNRWLTATASFSGKSSPPPFVAGFAEVEVDTDTGRTRVVDMVGVVDCGTVVNLNLAKVQAEGGFAQGIGMALYEDVHYNAEGRALTDSFLQYRIPSRLDVPDIRIAFEQSYEPSGPFGAKSIGEVVINTPTPAIVSAIAEATGVDVNTLPVTAEKLWDAMQK